MIVDLVEVGERTDLLSDNVAFSKGLELAPDAGICIFNQTTSAAFCLIILCSFHIDPDLDFDSAGAIVQLVCDVCCLLADVANLTDESDSGELGAVDGKVFRVGLLCFEQLLDGDRA